MALRRFARDESGVAILEFAIFATLLLLLIFGSIDFGRAMFTANQLTGAAREGARWGAALPTPPNTTSVRVYTKTVMDSGQWLGSTLPANSNIVVTCLPNCPGAQQIRVRLSFPFTWLTPLPQLMGRAMKDTLHATATFRYEGS